MSKRTKRIPDISIEEGRVLFSNFSGIAKQYNPAGARNFSIELNNETAAELEGLGFNIRWPNEEFNEYGDQLATMQVKVNLNPDSRPPTIYIVAQGSNRRTVITADNACLIDSLEIIHADIVIHPYSWVTGTGTKVEKHGVSAYLKTAYIVYAPDPFEHKYNQGPTTAMDIPDGEVPF